MQCRKFILWALLATVCIPVLHAAHPGNNENTEHTYECQICFDDVPAATIIRPGCNEDGHQFCQGCCRRHLEIAMQPDSEYTAHNIRCPGPHCEHILTDAEIRRIFNFEHDAIDRFYQHVNREVIRNLNGLKQCPGVNCNFAIENPDDVRELFTCPACNTQFCTNCQRQHNPQHVSCENVIDIHNLNEEDRRLIDWAREYDVKCCPNPNCNAPIHRIEGCPHMRCNRCTQHFEWDTVARPTVEQLLLRRPAQQGDPPLNARQQRNWADRNQQEPGERAPAPQAPPHIPVEPQPHIEQPDAIPQPAPMPQPAPQQPEPIQQQPLIKVVATGFIIVAIYQCIRYPHRAGNTIGHIINLLDLIREYRQAERQRR